jgi:hypothetical protein
MKLIRGDHGRALVQRMEGIQDLNFLPRTPGIMRLLRTLAAGVLRSSIRPSAKLNGLEPEAYLRDLFTRIGEHSINRLDELLPWNTAQSIMQAAA